MSDGSPSAAPAYVERLSGAVVATFGVVLYALVIPAETEAVSYGWTRPSTMPSVAALTLAVAGLWQAAAPRPGAATTPWRQWARAASVFAAASALVAALNHLGFLVAGPLFVAALMLFIGERRPLWIVGGAVAFPLALWAIVVYALGRPLP